MDNGTQRFKFSLPILKTSVEIQKDENGNEKEIRFVEGIASSTDKDLHGDKMAPSAIKSMADSLKLHIINLNDEHNTSWQSELGELIELDATEDNKLRIKARLNEMSKATDLWYALTDLNKKLGLSIGGYVKEYEMEKDESGDDPQWIRVYKDIELDHIAVTSRPANPKTWVSVISKSIETSEENLKKVEKRVPATYNKEQTLKELAHKIVRSIQNMEADLLLELGITGLGFLNEEQLKLVERNLPMNKKDVSLEADEAKKKADADVQPEDKKAETPATPENESSDDKSKVDEKSKEEAKDAEDTDAEKSDEAKDKSAEKSESDDAEAVDKKASDEEDKADAEDSDTEKDKSKDDSGKEKATDDSKKDAEDTDSAKSDEGKSEDKSDKADDGQLLKAAHELSESLKTMVKTNEELAKRLGDLETQPADRKTIEVKKVIGDDTTEEVDAKALKKERDEKIVELKKTHATDPALFSMIQKVRSDYASKVQQLE